MKKAIVSVINDLSTDQRVHKACLALQKSGYEVLLVGRELKLSAPLLPRSYNCKRMRLIFSKGPFFYIEFNIRLLLFLLFKRTNLLLSNDLDTLLPNYLVSKVRNKPLLFDSHEYFTQTPELIDRHVVQWIWKRIERFVVPRLDQMITVNESIAHLFRQEYKLQVHVVRNIPPRFAPQSEITRKELGLPEGKKLLIFQGAGINMHRGAEEMVEAMTLLPECVLLFLGDGDVVAFLKQKVQNLGLADRVLFLSKMPYLAMMQYTRLADIGLSLDKDTNLNYRFSLPNKLFDYIHAGIPVLASPLPEIKKILDTYQTGLCIVNHEPAEIARTAMTMLGDEKRMAEWKTQCLAAAESLCWENEEKILLEIYAKFN